MCGYCDNTVGEGINEYQFITKFISRKKVIVFKRKHQLYNKC